MKQLLTVLCLALSFGCATTSHVTAEDSESESAAEGVALASADAPKKKPKQLCTRSRVTGTHLYTRICRSEEQVESERNDAQNSLNRPAVNPRFGQ